MRTPEQALAYLRKQHSSGSTSWSNRCEMLCRSAYGLEPHFTSAENHFEAIPPRYRHGHQRPRRGDLVLFSNDGYGHIVIANGVGWQGWSNDYGGRGRVSLVADVRALADWCGADEWYVADAWWSQTNKILTHQAPKPSRHLRHLLHLAHLIHLGNKRVKLSDHQRHVIHVWNTEGREIA